jgi:Ca-activated chloride channel family protein
MNWSDFHRWFAQEWGLWLLTVMPALAFIAWLARWRKRHVLARLGSGPAIETLLVGRRKRHSLMRLCWPAGSLLLIMGIAGPQWGRERSLATAPGRDLVVVLDMSRSMLAQDVLGQSSPNRLGRAKDALLDLVDTIERRGGHRLALLVFAARPQVVCPLTHDYGHFRDTLRGLDADDPLLEIGPPPNTAVSGTRIGAALRQAVATQDQRFQGHQDILLLSDGDDPADDEEWRAGSAAARQQGIPVHSVGIGDPDKGSPIPNGAGGNLRFQGDVVLTRLQEKPLQEIARFTKGVYTPARTQALPLGELFRERIEPKGGYENADDALPIYHQRAAWFFAGALFLLALDMAVGERRAKKASAGRQPPVGTLPHGELVIVDGKAAPHHPAVVALLTIMLLSAAPVRDAEELLRQGNAAFGRDDFAAALDFYTQAAQTTTDPGLVTFNQAAALYRLGRYREAELHYFRCLEDATGERRARVLYDLGNSLVMEAQDRDAKRLQQAIDLYEACLRQPEAGSDVVEDARANLDLAKVLLARAKARKDDRGHENVNPDDGNPGSENSRVGPDSRRAELQPGFPEGTGQVPAPDSGSARSDGLAKNSQPPAPGVGNLRPIPEDGSVSISPEDTAAYLQTVADRVLRERREHRRSSAAPLPTSVRNW